MPLYFFMYFVVVLIATTVGALTGMGGGIILKPLMDMIGQYDAATIGILSSFTVLTMSCVSLIKQKKQQVKVDRTIALSLASGSIVGGYWGDVLLTKSIYWLSNSIVVVAQNISLSFLLVVVICYIHFQHILPTLRARHFGVGFCVGILAGTISTFLGIGGGPINVAMLLFVFSVDIKQAVVNSLITIFFAQVAKLLSIVAAGSLTEYDLSALIAMLPAAIMGGWVGSKMNKQFSDKNIKLAFNSVQILVLLTCIRNIINNI